LTATDGIAVSTKLAAALLPLASCKIGRGGGWIRARKKLARGGATGAGNARAAGGRGSSSLPGPPGKPKRYRDWLRVAVAALWIALLLAIVGYLGFSGGAGLADLEAIGFAPVTE
jgi:hypothetical protein